MHRQHVDDVAPVVASPVAVAHELRGDRVAVGLVMGKDAAELVGRDNFGARSVAQRRLSRKREERLGEDIASVL
jgi:hypothetical protein